LLYKIITEKPKIVIIAQMNWNLYNNKFPRLITLLSYKYDDAKIFGEYPTEEHYELTNYHIFNARRVYLLK